jgi:hypothetical protein
VLVESPSTPPPLVYDSGMRPEMTIVPDKKLKISQIYVALVDAAAEHFLVSVNVIILLQFTDVVLKKILELSVKLNDILLLPKWEFSHVGSIFLDKFVEAIRPDLLSTGLGALFNSHLRLWIFGRRKAQRTK